MNEKEKTKLNELQVKQPVRCLEATDWKAFIQSAIKTGLESPIPYKVIPYKNGIGIKKIEFIKPKKIDPNLKRFLSATKFKQS